MCKSLVVLVLAALLIVEMPGCKGSTGKPAAGDKSAGAEDPDLQLPHDPMSEWPDGIRLTNGSVTLLVVPSIGGRIMSFGLTEVDASNVLWINPRGRELLLNAGATTKPTWKNFGGDKAWPWPEEEWPLRIGRKWPPPMEVDQMPMSSRLRGGLGVRLESRPIAGYGVKLVREIAVDPANPAATIVTRFESASADLPPPELAAWQITQLPAGGRMYARLLTSSSAIVGLNPAPWEGHHAISSRVVMIDPPEIRAAKIGLDADMLAWAGGEIVFVAHSEAASRETSGYRSGERAQVFIQAAPNPAAPSANTPSRYVEYEFTSPRRDLANGKTPELRVTWTLYRREDGKWSDADVAKLLAP